jgi:hypothetical protein
VVEELHTVVDRQQMSVRILPRHELAQPDPVGHGLRVHEVVLVGQREPDIWEAGQSADDVANQVVVHGGAQVREAPPVVGVEQDQVHLHPELAETPDMLVEPREKLEIELGVVERPFFGSRKGEPLRLIGVVHEVLGKQAHPELRER